MWQTPGTDLNSIYTDIAGELQQDASINTHVALDFSSGVEVNGTVTAAAQVFQYEYLPPHSGQPTQWTNSEVSPFGMTRPTGRTTRGLTFDPGTITVNQQWMVNFTLTVLAEGNIKVLSSQDLEDHLRRGRGRGRYPGYLHHRHPGRDGDGAPEHQLHDHFVNLERTNPESDTKIASMNGTSTTEEVTKTILQQIWVAPVYTDAYQYVDTSSRNQTSRLMGPNTYTMIISDLPPGQYHVKVIGHVSDANDASDVAVINIPTGTDTPQIKIQ